MGKTPERRVLTSTSANSVLRYRRKAPVPTDNQRPEQQPTVSKHKQFKSQQEIQQSQQLKEESHRGSRSSRSPTAGRFQPKFRHSKQQQKQQPALLKQLLWKAKAVQRTPAAITLAVTQQPQQNNCNEEEDEEAVFAKEQRQMHKLLASEAEALAATKRKRESASVHGPSSFVPGSSSQETQSGSEDDVIFLPYSDLLPNLESSAKWEMEPKERDNGAEDTDGEDPTSPVMPSDEVEKKEQDGLEKEVTMRRKQRQKYKLKQKLKRAAAKEHKRQHQQKQEGNRLYATEDDGGSTQNDENEAVDIFHPSTNLASEMDPGVCRAVLSQLKEVVPFIVVGDVACPVMAGSNEQLVGVPRACVQSETSTIDSEVAEVDFRHHVIAMLDRSKETQMKYRESFVVENSGFDAASSYDFFKHRFCEIQRSAGVVYY